MHVQRRMKVILEMSSSVIVHHIILGYDVLRHIGYK